MPDPYKKWQEALDAYRKALPRSSKTPTLTYKAAEISFSAEELGRLTHAFPPGAAAGERYPPAMMKRIGL